MTGSYVRSLIVLEKEKGNDESRNGEDDSCNYYSGDVCHNCPASTLSYNEGHLVLFGVPEDAKYDDTMYMTAKIKWFKNWLKENDK